MWQTELATLRLAVHAAMAAMWRDAHAHERFYKQDWRHHRRRAWKHRRSSGRR